MVFDALRALEGRDFSSVIAAIRLAARKAAKRTRRPAAKVDLAALNDWLARD